MTKKWLNTSREDGFCHLTLRAWLVKKPGCGTFFRIAVAIKEEMTVNTAVKTAEKFISEYLQERGLVTARKKIRIDLTAETTIFPRKKKLFVTPNGCYTQ
ncbi:TPA: hypothetical protein DCP88_03845 [Candidatus Campbellbacteria bacterium]|jgi:hypothetical protein|nr:MAG: hypothetical protein UR58_C0001G0032 [Candidatus Campbellbacteria bacterium GW2011_OD1_34_28]HAP74424.1 hypothetical protein [Candidatus Campbellbacteria bacterium]